MEWKTKKTVNKKADFDAFKHSDIRILRNSFFRENMTDFIPLMQRGKTCLMKLSEKTKPTVVEAINEQSCLVSY
jgi:hypothetical protein